MGGHAEWPGVFTPQAGHLHRTCWCWLTRAIVQNVLPEVLLTGAEGVAVTCQVLTLLIVLPYVCVSYTKSVLTSLVSEWGM